MTSALSSICMPGDAIVEDTEVGRAHLLLGQCMLTVSNPLFFFFCLGPWFVGSTTAAAPQRRFEELFSPQGQGWSKVRVVLVSPGCVCHPLGGVHGWGQRTKQGGPALQELRASCSRAALSCSFSPGPGALCLREEGCQLCPCPLLGLWGDGAAFCRRCMASRRS